MSKRMSEKQEQFRDESPRGEERKSPNRDYNRDSRRGAGSPGSGSSSYAGGSTGGGQGSGGYQQGGYQGSSGSYQGGGSYGGGQFGGNAGQDRNRAGAMEVMVEGNNIDKSLKLLKRKLIKEGIFRELKARRYYEKKSEKKKRKLKESLKKIRKELARSKKNAGLMF
jgi:small subunit ribosomal protein S21